jgi:L-histidine N-alpha-methyltransferase
MDGKHAAAWPRFESDPSLERMAEEVRSGLLRPLPELPCKYFYDDRGSRLFEEITRLPEYYPTRTELGILARAARDIVERARPRELVELGSGAGRKIRLLLDAAGRHGTRHLVFFDINEAFVRDSLARLRRDYPGLVGRGIVGDFTEDLSPLGPGGGRLLLFFGGTIGNLHPLRVPGFLREVASHLAPGDCFLLGVDLVKDKARLEAAYNDSRGVTAAFNRNILRVMNDRLGSDFVPADWSHVAFFDTCNSWIEMRLRASRRQQVSLPACRLTLDILPGTEIRTEISCKYTRDSLEAALAETGLFVKRWYTDEDALFALVLLRREDGA